MEPDKEKIKSPFEAPEGYFEGFEARLAEKLAGKNQKSGQLKVTHKRTFKIEWLAAAAAVAAVVITGWFIFKPRNNQEPLPIAKSKRLDTIAMKPVIEKPDSEMLAKNERFVVESIIEEVDEKTAVPPAANLALNSTEMPVASELEDAGLIVLDAEDGLFDEIEIRP